MIYYYRCYVRDVSRKTRFGDCTLGAEKRQNFEKYCRIMGYSCKDDFRLLSPLDPLYCTTRDEYTSPLPSSTSQQSPTGEDGVFVVKLPDSIESVIINMTYCDKLRSIKTLTLILVSGRKNISKLVIHRVKLSYRLRLCTLHYLTGSLQQRQLH
jgi:hypothetical protein